MTYKLDSTAVTAVVPEIAMLRINNNDTPLTTSSVILFEDNISNATFNGISSDLTITNAGLTLGAGHWQLQALVAIDNDDDLDNFIEYQWYVDGTATGAQGNSEIDKHTNADSADVCVSVDSGTVDLELKIINQGYSSGKLLLMEEYSPCLIWKVGV